MDMLKTLYLLDDAIQRHSAVDGSVTAANAICSKEGHDLSFVNGFKELTTPVLKACALLAAMKDNNSAWILDRQVEIGAGKVDKMEESELAQLKNGIGGAGVTYSHSESFQACDAIMHALLAKGIPFVVISTAGIQDDVLTRRGIAAVAPGAMNDTRVEEIASALVRACLGDSVKQAWQFAIRYLSAGADRFHFGRTGAFPTDGNPRTQLPPILHNVSDWRAHYTEIPKSTRIAVEKALSSLEQALACPERLTAFDKNSVATYWPLSVAKAVTHHHAHRAFVFGLANEITEVAGDCTIYETKEMCSRDEHNADCAWRGLRALSELVSDQTEGFRISALSNERITIGDEEYSHLCINLVSRRAGVEGLEALSSALEWKPIGVPNTGLNQRHATTTRLKWLKWAFQLTQSSVSNEDGSIAIELKIAELNQIEAKLNTVAL